MKRSALIPMLMYAQDEYGSVTDEIVAEIAKRLDLHTVQVEETLQYYSMLHRKPMGKHHVQVCTNIACMLRGGTELLEPRQEAARKSATKRLLQTACFRWKKWNVSGPARGAPGHSGKLRLL